ncbi:hypothetical protein IFM89_017141 [Coptis chinensis]|uniref:Uncharacterized protein n=1 Tax=Coptis chinensis TaxID=261450 RepID=A0A835LC11_9MAGN|nr:hypothetical protein IFM89_017141 [Coptis chinensis]
MGFYGGGGKLTWWPGIRFSLQKRKEDSTVEVCPEKKVVIVSEVEKNVWPAVAEGKVKPIVYKSFPLSKAAESHQLMESSKHIGKILLFP